MTLPPLKITEGAPGSGRGDAYVECLRSVGMIMKERQ